MITVSVVEKIEDFEQMKPAWDDLFYSSQRQSLFLTHAWLFAWWEAFKSYQKRELLILCVLDNNKLIGLAPMVRQKIKLKRIPISTICFMQNGHTPFSDFLFLPGKNEVVISAILSFLFNEESKYFIFQVGKLENSSISSSSVRKYCNREDINYVRERARTTPFIPTNTDWDDFLKSRSTKFRKSLRNKLNRLSRIEGNQIYCETIGRDITIEKSISRICHVAKRSWKEDNGSSINRISGSIQFHINIIKAIENLDGKAYVWWMKQGETFIAYELHLQYKDITYPILADYDKLFSNISPGSMVEYHAIKSCFDSLKINTYDSCADNYWYLKNWTCNYHEYDVYNIFPDCIASKIAFLLKAKVIPFFRPIDVAKI